MDMNRGIRGYAAGTLVACGLAVLAACEAPESYKNKPAAPKAASSAAKETGPDFKWSSYFMMPTRHAVGDINKDGKPDRVTYWFDKDASFGQGHGIWLELSQPDGSYTRKN